MHAALPNTSLTTPMSRVWVGGQVEVAEWVEVADAQTTHCVCVCVGDDLSVDCLALTSPTLPMHQA
jgi:hypothetical protein